MFIKVLIGSSNNNLLNLFKMETTESNEESSKYSDWQE